jgi:homoserine O-acetyltransferase
MKYLEIGCRQAYNTEGFHTNIAHPPVYADSMATELIDTITPDERSVGLVETQFARLFESPNELRTTAEAKIGPIYVAYETYGTLTPERDNAIFVCHALTGDAHAAGYHSADDKQRGWWDGLIGPGKGLDTDKYFVICANVLGGCQGTTGPGSINPATDVPYCLDFPVITVGDIVEVHAALVRHLGVDQLLSVIGGSLGGMQALEWAARFPDRLNSAIVLAAAANLAPQGIAFNTVGRRAIYADPQYQNGEYYGKVGPDDGLAVARMLAHITYLSEDSIEEKFGRRLQHSDTFAYDLARETEFQIESYLHYQGERFVARFDANSYLHLTKAMDYFNLADSYGSLANAIGRTRARFLVTSYSSDWLFPTSQSRELVTAMIETGRHVTFVELDSRYGHDAFLIEVDKLESLCRPFLEQAYAAVRSGRSNLE